MVSTPKISQDDFRCFFSAGAAWGQFSQIREGGAYTTSLQLFWGDLTLQTLNLSLNRKNVVVPLDDQSVPTQVMAEGDIMFATPLRVQTGQRLLIRF